MPKKRWLPALDAGEGARERAWVAELTEQVDLSGWPEGTRLIVRKERPHPGAQLRLTTATGTATSVSSPTKPRKGSPSSSDDTVYTRASRTASRNRRSSGSAGCPSSRSSPTRRGSSSRCCAKGLLAWLRLLVLEGELALAKPKRLRHSLLHVAGRLTRTGRRRTLHLPAAWPWREQLTAAFARVASLAPG